MKAGISINELAQRVDRNRRAKRDFISESNRIALVHDKDAGRVRLQLRADDAEHTFNTTPIFQRQLGARLKINANYWDKMVAEAPDLLATNANYWLERSQERRMIRTLADDEGGIGLARAVLSDRYKRIDNEQILQEVLPALGNIPGLQITDCELTEHRMYIKAITPRIAGEIKVGDQVQAGVVISNGEIGNGSLSVSPLVFRLVCLNGMVIPDGKFSAIHVGRKAEEGSAYELYTDETRQADDKAILLKARDVANGIFNQDYFDKLLLPMREAASDFAQTKRPDKAVEVLSETYGFNEEEQVSVLTHLLQGGDMSRWGFANAVTRAAQDVPSYDRSVDLERLGGAMMSMDRKVWEKVAEAA